MWSLIESTVGPDVAAVLALLALCTAVFARLVFVWRR